MLERHVDMLLDLGPALLGETDPDALLQRMLDAARSLTGARYAAIGVLDTRRDRLARFLTSGIDAETHARIGELPRGHGVLGELIRDPRPLRLADVGDHPRSYGFPIGHPPMLAFLGVPVEVEGVSWGNFYLTDPEDGEFTHDDEEALVALARWAGAAVANAGRLAVVRDRRAELERSVLELEATNEIARALAGETDLHTILDLVAKRGRALVAARAVLILLARGEQLEIAAVAGDAPSALLGQRVDIAGTVSGTAVESQSVQNLSDEMSRKRFSTGGLERLGLKASAGLFVPLVFRATALGVLVAIDRLKGDAQFDAHAERLLRSFAISAASAVATAQSVSLEAMQQREAATEAERRRFARELHDETLQGLAAISVALGQLRKGHVDEPGDRLATAAGKDLQEQIERLRDIIADVRPTVLDELGTQAALETLIDRLQGALRVTLDVDLDFEQGRAATRHVTELETAVYRIVQEALNNARSHAQAQTAQIRLIERDGNIDLEVRDDGVGFSPTARRVGFGLTGMRERAELVGGRLDVTSSPDDGTRIRARLPVKRRARAESPPSGGASVVLPDV